MWEEAGMRKTKGHTEGHKSNGHTETCIDTLRCTGGMKVTSQENGIDKPRLNSTPDTLYPKWIHAFQKDKNPFFQSF